MKSEGYGIVYKIEWAKNSPSGWQGVYVLYPDGKDWVEVCYGHLSKVYVDEGDFIREDDVVGLEGNRGEVYYGSERITKAMQDAGDKRGSHVHEQYRPVKKVRHTVPDFHYLNRDGKPYRDKLGYYYEIKYTNDTQRCVNPYLYVDEKGPLAVAVVNKLLALFKK